MNYLILRLKDSRVISLRIYLAMKLTVCIFFLSMFGVLGNVNAQRINIDAREMPLQKVLIEIGKQSKYILIYDEKDLNETAKVTCQLKNKDLAEALDIVLSAQPIHYEIKGKSIVISKALKKETRNPTIPTFQDPIRGRITDDKGNPLAGATVRLKGASLSTVTNNNGDFVLHSVGSKSRLEISYMGFITQEVAATRDMAVLLSPAESKLDEAVVIAYGSTTQRLNTGSVSRVTAEDIAKQPATNVLNVLSGRVPGLVVNQSSGTPGSSFSMQIRGRNSISQGSEPLILIDGIPFASGNDNINNLVSAIGNTAQGGGLSPFYSINPADIESIEVLKDADATAIYGSRGANGVILITTRKGKAGKTQVTANFSQGVNRIGPLMELLDTEEYLAMRREAFENSEVTPDISNAPDLTVWDQSKYTNLQKELLGNTGHVTNAQLSLSGGNNSVQFLIGGGYLQETNIFPGNLPNRRGSVNANLSHTSTDERLHISLSGSYNATLNKTTEIDFTSHTLLPPNIPAFYDEEGNLNWEEGGTTFTNPYGYLHRSYRASTGNLASNLNISYKILPSLTIKALLGYNKLNGQETRLFPKSAMSPASTLLSSSSFGNTQNSSWSAEPQVEYRKYIWKGELSFLAGGTFQEIVNNSNVTAVSGFSSDALMESMAAADNVDAIRNTHTVYRYQAIFGRANYNIQNKYIVNITGRRDGSSRFGTGQRYANFGAVGAAWIFTEEDWFKSALPILSYGKLRGSYGITGNDQIGDYQYLDAWGTIGAGDGTYQGNTALFPLNLFNPTYGWEENRKLEAAVELGFWQERLMLNVDYFRNRSDNQLVIYRLPYQTGFANITNNLPALVENRGWEIQVNGDVWKGKSFQWNSAFNITIPKNTLLNFPDLESSAYASSYIIGESLNLLYNYRSVGVDPETGLYHFLDVDEDGSLSSNDWLVNGTLDPRYYGGFRNTFHFKGFGLDVFFDYRKQTGRNYLSRMYSGTVNTTRVPGSMTNQPDVVLGRWQNVGDQTDFERFSYMGKPNLPNISRSDIIYSDQSFIRLRSLHFSYSFSGNALSAIKASNANIYFQGQNLYTWNRDKGYDPETQSLVSLPTLKTYTIGVQITY